ncbi:outer membrane lipoprotein carrier protein LolA [Fulvivirga sp. M361]|nr:outer membrane lipoprotein carrier protein LolA [Fulvivirga sp. M361]
MLLLVMAKSSFAQYDPKARKVLDNMSDRIKSIEAYSADISNSLINEADGINDEFKGKIVVKNDMYKLELEEQVVINNGTTVWTYLPDVNEVNIDNYDPDEDEITPSKIYEAYKNGYKYILIGEETKNGELTSVVDLVPNDTDAQFFKIKLYIAKKDHLLKGWTMFEKSGNQYVYQISNFNDKITAKDSEFEFEAANYPGVDIIDLR